MYGLIILDVKSVAFHTLYFWDVILLIDRMIDINHEHICLFEDCRALHLDKIKYVLTDPK